MNFSSRKIVSFSGFVAVLKISLLWRTLLLQRKWVPRKRRPCKVTEISMPEMPIILCIQYWTELWWKGTNVTIQIMLFINFTLRVRVYFENWRANNETLTKSRETLRQLNFVLFSTKKIIVKSLYENMQAIYSKEFYL